MTELIYDQCKVKLIMARSEATVVIFLTFIAIVLLWLVDTGQARLSGTGYNNYLMSLYNNNEQVCRKLSFCLEYAVRVWLGTKQGIKVNHTVIPIHVDSFILGDAEGKIISK